MKYKYLVVDLARGAPTHPEIQEKLNTVGADGWELIAVDDEHAYLKKPDFTYGTVRPRHD